MADVTMRTCESGLPREASEQQIEDRKFVYLIIYRLLVGLFITFSALIVNFYHRCSLSRPPRQINKRQDCLSPSPAVSNTTPRRYVLPDEQPPAA